MKKTRVESIESIMNATKFIIAELSVEQVKAISFDEVRKSFGVPHELTFVLVSLKVIARVDKRNKYTLLKPDVNVTLAYAEKLWIKIAEYKNERTIRLHGKDAGRKGLRTYKPLYLKTTVNKSSEDAKISIIETRRCTAILDGKVKMVHTVDALDKQPDEDVVFTAEMLNFIGGMAIQPGQGINLCDNMFIKNVERLEFVIIVDSLYFQVYTNSGNYSIAMHKSSFKFKRTREVLFIHFAKT